LQALAAVFGGTQSLHTNSRDEALALPTEDSARIALRTQQIIAYESGVTRTADPLAGSYYLENLTHTIEKEVLVLMEKVERLGGARQAIESGFVLREIQESAYAYQKYVDEGQKIIVGVNKFTDVSANDPVIQKIDPKIEQVQVMNLRRFKKSRDPVKTRRALSKIAGSARKPEVNMLPSIMSAVRAKCTVGEISDVLRSTFGEYRKKETFS
jgi:methylmalonyl-CoA mutase N-terminal domain/subunit